MALKEFVIFRHAHRLSGGSDPELSEVGRQQATRLVQLVQQKLLPVPQMLLSSPKLRARQTLAPLKKALQIPHGIDPNLDERTRDENGATFENRVKNFLREELPVRSESCIYLCTHLDWLEVFGWAAPVIEDLSADLRHLQPADYFHFQLGAELSHPWSLIKKGGLQ
jgi:broad specificity phosphatase PhoE